MKISISTPSLTLIISLLFLSAGASSTLAFAQTYKCSINGSTTYSQTPCSDGVSTPANIPTGKIPAADYQEGLKRNKKDTIALKKLEDARHKDELKREKEMKPIVAKNARDAQKCAELRANEKWTREDLANASPKTEKKERSKLNRATEKVTLYCKTS